MQWWKTTIGGSVAWQIQLRARRFYCRCVSKDGRMLLKTAATRFVGGIAIGAPILAISQGTYLLYDFRRNHGTAPRPAMPSQGVVVVTTDDSDEDINYYGDHNSYFGKVRYAASAAFSPGGEKTFKQIQREKSPLRLLVIGDSLAAGVGTIKSSTPVLPESIAHALSKAMGGRPVYWNCVGVPGYTASEIVKEIHHLDSDHGEDDNNTGTSTAAQLLRRFQDWQNETRQRAEQRYEASKQKAIEWQKQRQLDYSSTTSETTVSDSDKRIDKRIVRWFQRTKQQVTQDVQCLKEVISPPMLDTEQQQPTKSKRNEVDQLKIVRKPTRRNVIDPSMHVEKYDIAVVLTGLNDLKGTFLPFMNDTQSRNPPCSKNDKSEVEGGLKAELLNIIDALKHKMRTTTTSSIFSKSLATSTEAHQEIQSDHIDHKNTQDKTNVQAATTLCSNCGKSSMNNSLHILRDGTDDDDTGCDDCDPHWQDDCSTGPLVVFPALPYAPIELTQWVPLRWFLIPLLRGVDKHKEMLAKRYPGLVLYVDYPNDETITDAESRRGPLWDGIRSERVHFKITDVTQAAQEGILRSMQQYYDSWVSDASSSSSISSTEKNTTEGRVKHHKKINRNDDDYKDDATNYLYKLNMFDDDVTTIPQTELVRPEYLGSSLVAVDGIHPNDHGYDLWGRHIACAIVEEIKVRRKSVGPIATSHHTSS